MIILRVRLSACRFLVFAIALVNTVHESKVFRFSETDIGCEMFGFDMIFVKWVNLDFFVPDEIGGRSVC